MSLPYGTLLQGGKYKIERVLGQGGFGITYQATQVALGRKVAIKEFFFKDYCYRKNGNRDVITIGTTANKEWVQRFRKKFIKEAQMISKLHHQSIVHIYEVFEENCTAYYVMECLEGESLSQMISRRGAIPEHEALRYISSVANALNYVHSRNINHLDVKPNNIIHCNDGRIMLIDFGVSKQYDVTTGEGTTTTPVGRTPGYSPFEQYVPGGVQSFSPESDVYALAATLYTLLTGMTPPDALHIQDLGLPTSKLINYGVSQSTIQALSSAMQPRNRRTKSITAFINQLNPTHKDEVIRGQRIFPVGESVVSRI